MSLTIGEPDLALFDPKSNYTEMKPSEVQRRIFEKVGEPFDRTHQRGTEKLDQEYQKRH